jgi:hypothetical protein
MVGGLLNGKKVLAIFRRTVQPKPPLLKTTITSPSGRFQNGAKRFALAVKRHDLIGTQRELRVGLTVGVAKLDLESTVIQNFNHRADFSRAQFPARQVFQQGDRVKQFDGFDFHLRHFDFNTKQVVSLGKSSPCRNDPSAANAPSPGRRAQDKIHGISLPKIIRLTRRRRFFPGSQQQSAAQKFRVSLSQSERGGKDAALLLPFGLAGSRQ